LVVWLAVTANGHVLDLEQAFGGGG
jgi:hypothetical protein